jgi:vacuolar-type H+-ATPase subunit I/STV1
MVWRRMKAAGAVGLQNGVWVLPHSKEQVRFLQELLDYLKEQGASGQSFTATALNQSIENDLLERFQTQRDEEYAELIERCQDLLSELDKETQNQKFTFAELEENEDDLQKLRNWLARIDARDYVGGKRADEASQQVEACAVALDEFANQVYIREKLTSRDDPSN